MRLEKDSWVIRCLARQVRESGCFNEASAKPSKYLKQWSRTDILGGLITRLQFGKRIRGEGDAETNNYQESKAIDVMEVRGSST